MKQKPREFRLEVLLGLPSMVDVLSGKSDKVDFLTLKCSGK